MAGIRNILVLLLVLLSTVASNRVLELSDRFLEVRNNGVWLVMFYAPWCGHCKNLEPIWNQVAQSLVDTDIRVGRLDCTRFSSVAVEFSVSGFPTILFIKGHKTVEYKGDRERYDIVEFARRMDGPAVRHFVNCEQFQVIKKDKKVFFVYVNGAKLGEGEELKDNFTRIAEEFQTVMNFYTVPAQCISLVDGVDMPKEPSIFVCKDGSCFRYEETQKSRNKTLYDWVNKERFPSFIKVTHGNFYQLMKSGKYVVIAVLEENQIGGLTLRMSEFRDVLEAIAVNNKDIYHEHFIFGWLGQPEVANNIAMTTLSIPSLLVVNSTTYEYYLPVLEEDEKVPSPQSILELLDKVKNNSAEAHGGETFFYRLYRTYYGAKTSLMGMWKGNPVLTTVLLGLPLGLFSIICYTTCCTDLLDAGDEDDETETGLTSRSCTLPYKKQKHRFHEYMLTGGSTACIYKTYSVEKYGSIYKIIVDVLERFL
ncbi:protein disulfide-isomerase TMX3-like isoform X2 [Stegodyphus dumicola]|uniref:protein disulfide-isomerase TMX3-like isoform X2 n=1 Tax=Stegodyphus dumicola TaxID=202533 RepID=UPI0015B09172|nr:protein disulfide-isomerase TMX3-like isoform X2 [Stegodyphus dumicola]